MVAANLKNKRYGILTVIDRVGSRKGQVMWLCRCDCGNERIASSANLIAGHHHSCGCQKGKNVSASKIKHGLCGTRIHSIHRDMLARCYNPHRKAYKNYGGRGIGVCDEWRGKNGLKNFHEWAMANGYTDQLTVDRIDVNGNYEPQNCRWVTQHEQVNNTRRNIYVTLDNETHTLSEWCEIKGLNYPKVYQRVHTLKWDYERALTQ